MTTTDTTTTEAPARSHRDVVRVRSADALKREINSWTSEMEAYGEYFTDAERAKIARLLQTSRALYRSLIK